MDLCLRPWLIAICSSLCLSTAAIAADLSTTAINDRIKPIGNVHIEGATPPAAAVTTSSRTGQAVYDRYCGSCHNSGLMGAPKKAMRMTGLSESAKVMRCSPSMLLKALMPCPQKGPVWIAAMRKLWRQLTI